MTVEAAAQTTANPAHLPNKKSRWRARFLIANGSHHLLGSDRIRVTLDELPLNQLATIAAIDWGPLDARETQRLGELGFEEGAQVTVENRGVFGWRDPLAVRIGRMTVAIRRAHAAVMQVEPDPA